MLWWTFSILFLILQLSSLSLQSNDSISRHNDNKGPCPEDYLRIKNKCFYFSNGTATWQDAYYECKDRNSSFAVIKGSKLNTALRTYLNKNKHYIRSEERWIGGIYDWNQKHWKWTGSQKPMKFRGFYHEESTNRTAWQCVILDPKYRFKWNAKSCVLKKHYICEKKMKRLHNTFDDKQFNGNQADNQIPLISPVTYTKKVFQYTTPVYDENAAGFLRNPEKKQLRKKLSCPSKFVHVKNKCYFFGTKELIWQEAYWNCHDMNATLATLNNKEDVILKKFIKKRKLATSANWLNGRFDWEQMQWKWADSGNFIQNQIIGAEEMRWHCLLWNPKLQQRWFSDSCIRKHTYICEMSPTVMNIYTSRKLQSFPLPKPHVKIDFSVDGKTNSAKIVKLEQDD